MSSINTYCRDCSDWLRYILPISKLPQPKWCAQTEDSDQTGLIVRFFAIAQWVHYKDPSFLNADIIVFPGYK